MVAVHREGADASHLGNLTSHRRAGFYDLARRTGSESGIHGNTQRSGFKPQVLDGLRNPHLEVVHFDIASSYRRGLKSRLVRRLVRARCVDE